MKTFLPLAILLLCSAAPAAVNGVLKPVRVLDVSLRNVDLQEGDRIACVEMEVAGASISAVRIPIDWNCEVDAPVSGVAVFRGEAAHGIGMPFTVQEFQRFLTLAIYDYGKFNVPLKIKAKLTIYRYDKSRGEAERTLDLPAKSLALEKPI